jgi:hypothetical protein
MHVEELGSHMRPTGGPGDPITGEQLVETGIAIGIDDGESSSDAPADSLRRGRVNSRTAPLAGGTAKRPLIANISIVLVLPMHGASAGTGVSSYSGE